FADLFGGLGPFVNQRDAIGKPWNIQDQKYLIKFHKDKYADLSLALGRTYKTIADRIYNLRRSGEIK
uniref:hypothetical protein n=1 Tax=Serratia quinivorans TaxID=137545 RepID=UPI0035C698BA